MKGIKILFAAMFAATATCASADSVQFNLSGARSYGRWGGEISAGYRVQFAIFDITPLAGSFLTDNGHGYDEKLDSQGFQHCFGPDDAIVNEHRCRGKTRGFAALEAGVSIPLAARIAVGARYIGSEIRPYGSVAVPLFSKVAIKVNGGQHYIAAGLNLGVGVGANDPAQAVISCPTAASNLPAE
jgi:hypothetical protein